MTTFNYKTKVIESSKEKGIFKEITYIEPTLEIKLRAEELSEELALDADIVILILCIIGVKTLGVSGFQKLDTSKLYNIRLLLSGREFLSHSYLPSHYRKCDLNNFKAFVKLDIKKIKGAATLITIFPDLINYYEEAHAENIKRLHKEATANLVSPVSYLIAIFLIFSIGFSILQRPKQTREQEIQTKIEEATKELNYLNQPETLNNNAEEINAEILKNSAANKARLSNEVNEAKQKLKEAQELAKTKSNKSSISTVSVVNNNSHLINKVNELEDNLQLIEANNKKLKEKQNQIEQQRQVDEKKQMEKARIAEQIEAGKIRDAKINLQNNLIKIQKQQDALLEKESAKQEENVVSYVSLPETCQPVPLSEIPAGTNITIYPHTIDGKLGSHSCFVDED